MDDLDIAVPTSWEEDNREPCPLCEYADDAGSAMGHLKQMDTALGGRTDDAQLGAMMEETYNTFFRDPMKERNIEVPTLTGAQIIKHFTEHDINPLRLLKRDINRLEAIQATLCPRSQSATGNMVFNEDDAKQWMVMQRLKMDLITQFERTNNRTSTELPSVPSI